MKILRLPEVVERTGKGRSTIYKLVAEGNFPEPVAIGARAVGWYEHEIDDHNASRPRVQRGDGRGVKAAHAARIARRAVA